MCVCRGVVGVYVYVFLCICVHSVHVSMHVCESVCECDQIVYVQRLLYYIFQTVNYRGVCNLFILK